MRHIPNALCILRMLLVVPVGWLLVTDNYRLTLAMFAFAAATDGLDGFLAKRFGWTSELGKILDPLADKILLVATLVPVYLLMQPRVHWVARALGVESDPQAYPFTTPFGDFALPWWILAAVLLREFAMTVFRFVAARRGTVIGAIPAAKWKTTFQVIWIGGAYFWFFAATAAAERHWTQPWWNVAANAIGIIGLCAMISAVTLTMYSLVVYLRRYGPVLTRQAAAR